MGNSYRHFGHLTISQWTRDGQPAQARARPYVMSKVKPHWGHRTILFPRGIKAPFSSSYTHKPPFKSFPYRWTGRLGNSF